MLPRSATVLLVDDSADDRFILSACWEKAGISRPLLTLEDGQQAIAYLSDPHNPSPAFVLLDLKLPVRNGFEVLAWMRADDTCRRIVVIVLTSSDQPDDVRRAYECGANSYLVKPSSVTDLLELLGALELYWLRFNEFPAR